MGLYIMKPDIIGSKARSSFSTEAFLPRQQHQRMTLCVEHMMIRRPDHSPRIYVEQGTSRSWATNTKRIRATYKQIHALYKQIRAYTDLKLHVKVISFPESVFHEMFSVKLISLPLICSIGARAGGLPCNVPTAVAIEKTHGCSVHSTTLIRSIPEGISDMRVQPLLRALAGLASLRSWAWA